MKSYINLVFEHLTHLSSNKLIIFENFLLDLEKKNFQQLNLVLKDIYINLESKDYIYSSKTIMEELLNNYILHKIILEKHQETETKNILIKMGCKLNE